MLLNPQKYSSFLQGGNTCGGKASRISPGHYLTSLFLPRTNPPSFSRYQRATLISNVHKSAWERPTEAGLLPALPTSFLDSTAHISKGCGMDAPHLSVFFIPKQRDFASWWKSGQGQGRKGTWSDRDFWGQVSISLSCLDPPHPGPCL